MNETEDNGQQQINDEEAQQWFEEEGRETHKELIRKWISENIRKHVNFNEEAGEWEYLRGNKTRSQCDVKFSDGVLFALDEDYHWQHIIGENLTIQKEIAKSLYLQMKAHYER